MLKVRKYQKNIFAPKNQQDKILLLFHNLYQQSWQKKTVCIGFHIIKCMYVVLILFQHGPITNQGLLLSTGYATCYKKITKKKKLRECMVFIFRETVIICDKMTDNQPYSSPLFNYWISFQVCTYCIKRQLISKCPFGDFKPTKKTMKFL